MKPDKSIDCSGLFCPMPIVRTRQEIQNMKPGEVLEIIADDPGFEKDLPAWCNLSGEECLEMKKEGPIFFGYVKKVTT